MADEAWFHSTGYITLRMHAIGIVKITLLARFQYMTRKLILEESFNMVCE